MIKKSLLYCWELCYKPGKTFQKLLKDDKQYLYAWIVVIITGIVYQIMLGIHLFRKDMPMVEAIIRIPDDKYYLWMFVTSGFFTLCMYILNPGIMKLMGDQMKGEVLPFKKMFAMASYGTTGPMLLYWVSEMIFLGVMIAKGIHHPGKVAWLTPFLITSLVVVFLWNIVLFQFGLTVYQKLSWWKAAIVNFFTMLAYISLFIITMW